MYIYLYFLGYINLYCIYVYCNDLWSKNYKIMYLNLKEVCLLMRGYGYVKVYFWKLVLK